MNEMKQDRNPIPKLIMTSVIIQRIFFGSSTVPFVLFVFWSKPGFVENELICMSILCTIVPLLNKHSSLDRFRTTRESTSFPFSPCISTRTIAGEKPGDGRTLHLTWVANLVWIVIPWSLTGYSKCPLSAFSTLSTGWWMRAIPTEIGRHCSRCGIRVRKHPLEPLEQCRPLQVVASCTSSVRVQK